MSPDEIEALPFRQKYKRIRHPGARQMVDQVNDARERFPHLSQVSFHDDSFMAIPYGQFEEFAELWHDELKLPFAVYGVIANYVRQDKFELLSWAGMNRLRRESGRAQECATSASVPRRPRRSSAPARSSRRLRPRTTSLAYDIMMDRRTRCSSTR